MQSEKPPTMSQTSSDTRKISETDYAAMMQHNVTQILKAVEIMAAAIPQRDAAGKIEIYLNVKALLAELASCLDSEYIHHNYPRENLGRVEDAVAALSGYTQLGATEDYQWEKIGDRLSSALTLLGTPDRWPSNCILIDEDKNEVPGTNNPKTA